NARSLQAMNCRLFLFVRFALYSSPRSFPSFSRLAFSSFAHSSNLRIQTSFLIHQWQQTSVGKQECRAQGHGPGSRPSHHAAANTADLRDPFGKLISIADRR